MFGITTRRWQVLYLSVLTAALACTSCGSKGRPRLKCYPVTGQVLVASKPAAGALVVFYSVDKSEGKAVSASGVSDDQGKFTLSTYDTGDGAPAGDYQVGVIWQPGGITRVGVLMKKSGNEDQLQGRYKDPAKSGLKAHVNEQATELTPFNLK